MPVMVQIDMGGHAAVSLDGSKTASVGSTSSCSRLESTGSPHITTLILGATVRSPA